MPKGMCLFVFCLMFVGMQYYSEVLVDSGIWCDMWDATYGIESDLLKVEVGGSVFVVVLKHSKAIATSY